MQVTPQRNTRPELAIRSCLHRAGFRFRVDHRALAASRARPDIVFTGPRVAVFVDGCFWHGCARHMTWPRANAEWWRLKIEANQRRDAATTALYAGEGWTVVRVWEHDSPEAAAAEIGAAVRRQAVMSRSASAASVSSPKHA